MNDGKPTLWQLDLSHYSEKARWALDHKRVPHRRRSPLPGTHVPIAFALTRGAADTLPLLQLDGRTITDSTAIVAAIEERHPDPPLYPADPEQRRRALALEDFFDEQLGPHVRHLFFYELIQEPAMFAELASIAVPEPLGRAKGLIGAYARAYASLRFGADSEPGAALARAKIVAALDRLDTELAANGGEYLVGDGFTVADLTAASLFYLLVTPAEGPLPPEAPTAPAFERFRAGLRDRPGYRWVEATYRRHRRAAGA